VEEHEAAVDHADDGREDGEHEQARRHCAEQDAHSAGYPFIGWATVTRTGCVVAEYQGDPAETTRTFTRYVRSGGAMVPWRPGEAQCEG